MRKKFMCCALCVSLLALCGSAWADVTINSENFPDENFRDYVAKVVFKKNVNDTVSDEEIAAITKLDLTVVHTEIKSLEGIEHFTALTTLDCSQKSLTALDVSKNVSLNNVDCSTNEIATLTLGNNTNLTVLNCGHNRLEALDLSGCTSLTNLFCNNNRLRAIDLDKNRAINYLMIKENRLTTLDVTPCENINTLICDSQKVSTNALQEDAYGYKLYFNALSIDYGVERSLIYDIKAFDSSGNEVEFSDSTELIEFPDLEKRPSKLTYNYKTGKSDDSLMDVTVTLLKDGEDDDDDNPTPVTGGTGGGGGGCDSGFGFMGLIFVSAIAFRKRK